MPRIPGWLLRAVRIILLTALAVILLGTGLIQLQQRVLRHRAEQLLSDMHQIRLHQSTWQDAQKLMYRWGQWGHYEGQCTETGCRYRIILEDVVWMLGGRASERVMSPLRSLHAFDIYRWLGGRPTRIEVQFIVQDGTIWRTSITMMLEAPPRKMFDGYPYEIMVRTKSQQALRGSEDGGRVLGSEDELAQHPYYKAGRPGGCTMCLLAGVTYSTLTPQPEINRLTDFDLSCITRWNACLQPRDLLPAAREWHLYDYLDADYEDPAYTPGPPGPCDIPIWALARDADLVLRVEALASSGNRTTLSQSVPVRIIASLKGPPEFPAGAIVKIHPYTFVGLDENPRVMEPLTPGKHYILLVTGESYGKMVPIDEKYGLPLNRCGAQEDTSDVASGLEKGFAQNDALRGSELSWW
jgi:hypothetical protein